MIEWKDSLKIPRDRRLSKQRLYPTTQNGANGSNSNPRTNTAKPKSHTHFHRPPTNQTCTTPFPAPNNYPMRWQDSRVARSDPRSVIHHSNFPFRHEPSNRTPPSTSRSPLRAKPPEALNSIPHVPARPCIFAFRQSGAPIPWGFNQTTASEWSSLPAGW
jgi:hypothetical protein